MNKGLILASLALICLSSSNYVVAADGNYHLLTNSQSLYDVVAPVTAGDPPSNERIVGQIYYDNTAAAFKGVNKTGGVDTLTPPTGNLVVSTGSSIRVESAAFTPLSGASCTFTQNGNWIASATPNAAGDCTLTFVAGIWSATPMCTVTMGGGTGTTYLQAASISNLTTASIRILTNFMTSGSTGLSAGTAGSYIICVGH